LTSSVIYFRSNRRSRQHGIFSLSRLCSVIPFQVSSLLSVFNLVCNKLGIDSVEPEARKNLRQFNFADRRIVVSVARTNFYNCQRMVFLLWSSWVSRSINYWDVIFRKSLFIQHFPFFIASAFYITQHGNQSLYYNYSCPSDWLTW